VPSNSRSGYRWGVTEEHVPGRPLCREVKVPLVLPEPICPSKVGEIFGAIKAPKFAASIKLILKHLLPNALGPIIVTVVFGIPQAIFLEAALSFLGVGIQPPTPTWGQMVFDGYEAIYANPTSVVFPALAIGFTLLAFSFVGDGLRDALDPRMKR